MDWFNRFRRDTGTRAFLPEIDGLRFIAILSVFLCHLNVFFIQKNPGGYTSSYHDYPVLNLVTSNGAYGVYLFFVISGFILFLPFARFYINNEQKPSLKNYYLKRLSRIEPPYFLVMTGLFILLLFVMHQSSFARLFPSLLSSLTYTHNIFYGRDTLPLLNSVAWSLEVEVQFYLMAPFIARLFSLNKVKRRATVVSLMLFFMVIKHIWVLPFLSIYDYAHYFLAGFLLADFFVSGDRIFHRENKTVPVLFGILIFSAIWSFKISKGAVLPLKAGWDFSLTFMMFVFSYLVLFTSFWKSLLSKKILTTIGGMCYSIYLLHNPIIWSIDNLPFSRKFTDIYLVDWSIHFLFISFLVLAISGTFFILIEKPCMNRNWTANATRRIKGIFTQQAA
ncbi:peptidoglycan/LPS O-acetylase OafA/YrhL [Arcticibacter tournemirensis]|uniref:Acyltransferase n=1 Tax=Arcticibacter tournemirensis TaxID=699437 RepID=A0A5M9H8X4_9SPHI|nr:acyltransferase [Arcticibacter tournemirensis]KAA8482799.1 acyltransferase [Arcticibacter tournemirensis]TQM51100.1 peptidoglycan/LPS O-acetylase OafA/YrhL [Arcticibacter tournemirensis]